MVEIKSPYAFFSGALFSQKNPRIIALKIHFIHSYCIDQNSSTTYEMENLHIGNYRAEITPQ